MKCSRFTNDQNFQTFTTDALNANYDEIKVELILRKLNYYYQQI